MSWASYLFFSDKFVKVFLAIYARPIVHTCPSMVALAKIEVQLPAGPSLVVVVSVQYMPLPHDFVSLDNVFSSFVTSYAGVS